MVAFHCMTVWFASKGWAAWRSLSPESSPSSESGLGTDPSGRTECSSNPDHSFWAITHQSLMSAERHILSGVCTRPYRHICATCVPVCRGRTGHSSNPDHPLCAIANMSKSARERHVGARFSACPAAGASHEFTTLDTGIAITGTVRASCAIWRETVGISEKR